MCNEITILTLDTKFGTDTFAFVDTDLADFVIDDFVLKNWDKQLPDVQIPDDINDAVELFFGMTDLSYEIDTIHVFRSLKLFLQEDPL